MTNKERLVDIQNLKKHREFYALQQELEDFCDKMDSISDIDLSDTSRVTLTDEIYGRRWASEKVRELLNTLGLIDRQLSKKDNTFE